MLISQTSILILISTLFALAVSLPTNTTDPTSPSIPREFPKFSQNYTFVDNSSIRENLASHGGVDTEVDDLLDEDEDQPEMNTPTVEETISPVMKLDDEDGEDTGRKGVVEWIEDGGDTEDDKFGTDSTKNEETTPEATAEEETTEVTQETHSTSEGLSTGEASTDDFQEPYKDGVPVLDGTVAAILVGTFLVVCIFGYAALIIWRRSLELKYGSREMLVDSDEMYDPDDLKHFSI